MYAQSSHHMLANLCCVGKISQVPRMLFRSVSRIQKAFLPLIDQLTKDLTDLPQSSYRERATVLRYISRLYSKNRFEEAQEAKISPTGDYYGCVAYALAKAERTLDPSDAMLALHLALNIDPSHRLAHWANILFFATKPESTFV